MTFSETAEVFVVIPVHNGLDATQRCLESLRDVASVDALSVVVVDDGSTDGTGEYLRVESPDVHVVQGDGSLWWTGAVDAGCRYAIRHGAQILVLLNNDVIVPPDVLTELIPRARVGDACVGAVAVLGDNSTLAHAGGNLDWARRGITLRDRGRKYERSDALLECDWLPGTALAFSADLFSRVGGFDSENFPQYRGDVDFSLRVRRVGGRCLISHATYVINDGIQTGVDIERPVAFREFLAGFVSLRSNYNLRETFRFARKYCPASRRPRYLAQFYCRNVYAFVKHRFPHVAVVKRALLGGES